MLGLLGRKTFYSNCFFSSHSIKKDGKFGARLQAKRHQILQKKYKCNYLAIRIEYKDIKIKVFWVNTKGSEIWKMLISTDTDLTFSNAMKYYQIRWSIEVFFKDCKQNLNINKCQLTAFDAHIAWITLSFISYMMLSLRKRFDDYETMGEVFRDFKNELLEITLVEKLW